MAATPASALPRVDRITRARETGDAQQPLEQARRKFCASPGATRDMSLSRRAGAQVGAQMLSLPQWRLAQQPLEFKSRNRSAD